MSTVLIYPSTRNTGDDELWLTRMPDESLELQFSSWSRAQSLSEENTASESIHVSDGPYEEQVSGLRDGDALYRAMVYLLGEDVIDDDFYEQIVANVTPIAPEMLEAFGAAHRKEMERLERARLAASEAREAALAPYRATIAAFVDRFSNEKLHYPGAGRVYPSKRHWASRFIEEYILTHGELPTGIHAVQLQGYSGGREDFTEIAQIHAEVTRGVGAPAHGDDA